MSKKDIVMIAKEQMALKRQSNTSIDELYNVFISDPIRVTIAPGKEMMDEASTSDQPILSGDYMWTHLSVDFISGYEQTEGNISGLSPSLFLYSIAALH